MFNESLSTQNPFESKDLSSAGIQELTPERFEYFKDELDSAKKRLAIFQDKPDELQEILMASVNEYIKTVGEMERLVADQKTLQEPFEPGPENYPVAKYLSRNSSILTRYKRELLALDKKRSQAHTKLASECVISGVYPDAKKLTVKHYLFIAEKTGQFGKGIESINNKNINTNELLYEVLPQIDPRSQNNLNDFLDFLSVLYARLQINSDPHAIATTQTIIGINARIAKNRISR